ncbi:MAG TPA: hypothetical protein DEO32_05010 [Ruminococcaceae bacterium]|nr:hypothetical protein [Oscillospiraceae bacterium]
MNSNKTTKNKLIFNITLAAAVASAILTASVMTGCSSDKKVEPATEVVHETEIATYEVNGVIVDKDGNVLDEQGNTTGETVPSVPTSDKKENSAANDKKSSSSSKAQSSKASSKTQSSQQQSSKNTQSSAAQNSKQSSQQSSKSAPAKTPYVPDKSTDSASDLKLGNKRFKVGDTVTCTYSLQNTSEKLLNFQGYIKYDGTYLKVKSAKLEGAAAGGGLLNYNLNQEIRFNGSNLNGYNYTKNKAFLSVEYQVIKNGSTTPKIYWEVITGLSEKKYCDNNGNLTNGIKVTPQYN